MKKNEKPTAIEEVDEQYPVYFPKTKKCSAHIWEKVSKIQPNAKKTISSWEAWDMLSDYYKLTCDVYATYEGSKLILYKEDSAIHEFNWKERLWDDNEGDYKWDTILKDVFDWCIKTRLFKKGKWVAKTKEEINTDIPLEYHKVKKAPTLDELKKQLSRLSVRKSNYIKKGTDITQISAEMEDIRKQINELKTTKK